MKRQLSNNQTQLAQITLTLLGAGLPVLTIYILTFSDNNFRTVGEIALASLSILLGLSIIYFSLQLQNVSFDRDFIYIARFKQLKKIDIGNILEVKTSAIPFRLFYRNTYMVTLTYLEKEKKNRFHFLSNGATGIAGTIDNIPMLDILRQFIKDKKYSR